MSYGFQPPPPYTPGALEGQQPPFNPAYTQPPPYQHGTCVVIRNASTGLCIDGAEYDVKLQQYNGTPTQQWILESLGGGRHIIVNKANGAALDIEGGPNCGANLITYEKHGEDNQQWFINPDNTITSVAADYLAVDVCEGNCYPGTVLIAYEKHGGVNQQFNLQYL